MQCVTASSLVAKHTSTIPYSPPHLMNDVLLTGPKHLSMSSPGRIIISLRASASVWYTTVLLLLSTTVSSGGASFTDFPSLGTYYSILFMFSLLIFCDFRPRTGALLTAAAPG